MDLSRTCAAFSNIQRISEYNTDPLGVHACSASKEPNISTELHNPSAENLHNGSSPLAARQGTAVGIMKVKLTV